MIKRIDRYLFLECLGPVAIGFLVSTILLLVRSFFDLAEAMIRRDVPLEIALKLLALNLPHIVVITIPMALLFGILVAVGRLLWIWPGREELPLAAAGNDRRWILLVLVHAIRQEGDYRVGQRRQRAEVGARD